MLLNQFEKTYSQENGWIYGLEELLNGKLRLVKPVNYKFNWKGKEVTRNFQFKYFSFYNCVICGQQAIAETQSLSQKGARKDKGNVCELQTKGNSCSWKSSKDRNPFMLQRKSIEKRGSFENPIVRYGYPGYFEYKYTKDGMFDHTIKGGSTAFVRMHIIIAEKYILKRKSKKGECVHHINMDKLDYSVDNLWPCNNKTHKIAHNSYNYMCSKLMNNYHKYSGIGFNIETGKYYLINKKGETNAKNKN